MNCYVRSFKTFAHTKTLHAVEWDVVLGSVDNDVSTIVVPKAEADMNDVGEWIIAEGALLRIETVQPGTDTTALKCRDLVSAFDRDLVLDDLTGKTSVNVFIATTISRQFRLASDPHYAMSYITVSSESTGDIAYHDPETDAYGVFNFGTYLRNAARAHNIHLHWSIYSDGMGLDITVGRGTVTGGQLVLGAGTTQLAEAPVFSSAETARVTVMRKYEDENEEEQLERTEWYLYSDGTYGSDGDSAERVDGGWEYTSVPEKATEAEISEKVAQIFSRGMSDCKIQFWSERELTVGAPVNLRVEGKKYSGYITRKAVKSTDKRFLYQCGNLPVTLTDRLQRAEEAAEEANNTTGTSDGGSSSGGGSSGTSAVESVNGKTGAVTVGVEIVAGKDITPSSVKASSGGNVVAALYQTSDGRGVLSLRDKDHPNQDGVQAYALANGGGGILTRNGDGNTATTLSASAADMQSDAGAVVTFDASGSKRAVLGTNTSDAGTLRLFDDSGGAHDLTPAKIDQIGASSTVGPEVVNGEAITPSDVTVGNVAQLTQTSDGRGNFLLRRADGTKAVHAYALAGGAELDLYDSSEVRRVALYTGSAGDGRLQLRGTDNVNRFLTPSLLENAPMHNYLDNSDFTNPVNQRGETSYSGNAYCIDRWRIWDDASVSITERYSVTVTGSMFQYFEPLTLPNAICTLAVCDVNGNIRCIRGNPRLAYAYDNAAGLGLGYDPARSQMVVRISGEGAGLVWAALYRGSYEPAELPEYQPKGYAAELAECQRYFRISRVPVLPIEFPAYSGVYKLSVLFDTPMRAVPTVATYTDDGLTINAWYVTADGFHGNCSAANAYLVSWSASAEI